MSHFDYCSPVFRSPADSHLKLLQRAFCQVQFLTSINVRRMRKGKVNARGKTHWRKKVEWKRKRNNEMDECESERKQIQGRNEETRNKREFFGKKGSKLLNKCRK